MQERRSIRDMLCHICQRPAMATDAARIPYCAHHILRFVDMVHPTRTADTEAKAEAVGADVGSAASG